VFEIVIERIAAAETFDGRAGERAEPLGVVVVSRAENLAKILGDEITEALGEHRRDRLH
jgi:hypothetical protein